MIQLMGISKISRTLVTLGLLGLTIYFCFRNYHLRQEVSNLQNTTSYKSSSNKPDTVYLNQTLKPTKGYQDIKVPGITTYYLGGYYTLDKPSQIRDSISNGLLSDKISGIIMTTSSEGFKVVKDSLVQFLLDRQSLVISSVIKTDSNTIGKSQEFELDLDSYQYNWINNHLTVKRIPFQKKIKPYAYASYRYFHKAFDCGIGVSFKTKALIYKVGVNSFWYPNYKKDPGLDLEFKLEYNF